MPEATDWTAYYKKGGGIASVTRRITQRKVVSVLSSLTTGPVSICEFGGANSCVLRSILVSMDVSRYHVVDNNPYGLSLLPNVAANDRITTEERDILKPGTGDADDRFDIVFSIGLIEHFDREGTASAIDAHLAACKKGGIVLVTFPTPTRPYKVARGAAEMLGIWRFPDERPLEFDEVSQRLSGHGRIVHSSINWPIVLTQGYLAVQMEPDHP